MLDKFFKFISQTIPYYKNLKKISRFNFIRNHLKSKINFKNNIRNKNKKQANIAKNSYAYRFLIKKKRKLYKRTLGAHSKKALSTTEELELFSKKNKAIHREQKRHSFRQKFQIYSISKLLSNRGFKGAIIFIKHVRKNTFVNVNIITGENYIYDNQIIVKHSCGSIGYRNKKKTTEYARQQTIKTAGNFLDHNRFTSIDIIFTSHTSYWNKRALKGLIINPLYVRSLSITFNRAHSFIKHKKAQRI